MKYALITILLLAGCVDIPVMEVLPDPEEEVQGRLPYFGINFDPVLERYAVEDSVIEEIHYDRIQYYFYSKAEIRDLLHSHEWLREIEAHKYHRKCVDFAEMFQAVCLGMLPSAPVGTIEYWLPEHKFPRLGHKEIIFFEKKSASSAVRVFLVDPRTEYIRELNAEIIDIVEITM
ncbi:hypothetical protein ACFL6S_24170 [Candidatus Poribacteria bacterium]